MERGKFDVKISKLPFIFLMKNKYKNMITIIAIAVAVFGSFSVMTFLSIFQTASEGYLNVIKRYDMIIEKSGNMVQFIPTDSVINETVAEEIHQSLDIPAFPAIFQFVNGTSNRVIPNIIAGFTQGFMSMFFSDHAITEGRLPKENANEIAIGEAFLPKDAGNVSLGENFTINNNSFTVVGKYVFKNPVLDNFIIMSFATAKELSSFNNTCNIIFMEHASITDVCILRQFIEVHHSNLKLIIGSNADQISFSYGFQTSSWNALISFIAPFISISFSFTIFTLNYREIRKELWIFSSIGTPRYVYFISRSLETACILATGSVIGAVITHFVYPVFVLAALQMQGEIISFTAYVETFLRFIPLISSVGIKTLPISTLISFILLQFPYLLLKNART